MQPIHVIFTSILVACGEKNDTATTDTSDTSTISVNTDATFAYECYTDTVMCSLTEAVVSLDTETFSTYLDAEGQLTESTCSTLCQEQAGVYYDYLCSCDYQGVDSSGAHPVTCEFTVCAVEGRGHGEIAKLQKATGASELARYFVRAYHAEASSVAAFLQLRAELQAHGLSKALQERCAQAALEEVHHARMMAKLAGDEGCDLPTLDFGHLPKRSLFELAMDNAVEGCIFETFSALKAQYQAQHATDTRLLALMKVIARDETAHAQLAWDIHQSLMARLSKVEQKQIQEAQQQALQALYCQNRDESERQIRGFAQTPFELVEVFAQQIVA